VAVKGIKKKEHENLTDANIAKVIGLLEAEKPVSKKEACEILNISYNTARLAKIIEQYKYEQDMEAKRKAANRGKPASDFEKSTIIGNFLAGDGIAEIAKQLYRSPAFVKKIIEEVGVPEKGEGYWNPASLPDQCIATEFSVGQLVWDSRENLIGVIDQEREGNNPGMYKVYSLYTFSRLEGPKDGDKFWATNCNAGDYYPRYGAAAAYDLGSLEHLKPYGIDLDKVYRPHFPRHIKIALGMEVKN